MSQEKYLHPSPVQKEKFLSVVGYDYPVEENEGLMKTNRPFNKDDWTLSPWSVRYKFDTQTGRLFCELSHRMTNNRCYGWSHDGKNLPSEEVEVVYPSYLF